MLLPDAILKTTGVIPADELVARYVSASTVRITATSVILFGYGAEGMRFDSIDVTLDLATSGVNGLDAGSEASSTWYYMWILAKADGSAPVGLLSLSATAPTLPAGYVNVFKGLVGAVRNNGSSNLVSFFQRGNVVNMARSIVLTDGTATSYTAVDLSSVVPPIAKMVKIAPFIGLSTGTAAASLVVAPDGSGTTDTYGRDISVADTVSTVKLAAGASMVMMSTPQEVKYFVSGDSNAQATLVALGFQY